MGLHSLAERLNMTVTSMVEQMPISEYFDWSVYYRQLEKQQKEKPEKGSAESFENMSPDQIGAYFNVKR